MEKFFETIASYGITLPNYLITAGIVVIGLLLLGVVGRLVFGKHSTLGGAASSVIGIVMIYAIAIVLHTLDLPLQNFLAPLPLISFQGEMLHFFSFSASEFPVICTQLVNVIILAFLMNILDRWIPKGKNIFVWILLRILTIALAMILHLIVTNLLVAYLPEGIMAYSAIIVLAILLLMLLTGALKFLVGLALTTVNPIIAALYTFFFANIVGKQITKAVVTTAILSGIVFALEHFGMAAISIATAALIAYIPLLLVLVLIWYLMGRFL